MTEPSALLSSLSIHPAKICETLNGTYATADLVA